MAVQFSSKFDRFKKVKLQCQPNLYKAQGLVVD